MVLYSVMPQYIFMRTVTGLVTELIDSKIQGGLKYQEQKQNPQKHDTAAQEMCRV